MNRRGRKPPTAEQQRHQDAQRAHGCAMCLLLELDESCGPVRIHHRTVGDLHGNPRLGQDFTVALGDWHHHGVLFEGQTVDSMRRRFGPSFHHHKKAFLRELFDRLGQRSTAALQDWQDSRITWRKAA